MGNASSLADSIEPGPTVVKYSVAATFKTTGLY